MKIKVLHCAPNHVEEIKNAVFTGLKNKCFYNYNGD